jgi:hypothetical protein
LAPGSFEPEGSEAFAGGVESAAHGADGDIHDLGDFVVAELLHFAQDEGQAEVWSEVLQETGDKNSGFDLGATAGEGFVHDGGFGSAAAETVEAEADADAIEEAGKGAIIAEFAEFAERFEEGFLGDVFGFVGVAEGVRGDADELAAVALNEHTHGGFVADAAPGDVLRVFGECVVADFSRAKT